MPASNGSLWLHRPAPSPDPPARLFCFPFAGGSAQVFRSWVAALAPVAEVVAVALPGRGARLAEPAVPRIDDLVAELVRRVRPLIDRPYAMFGHSMGALVAYELARELRRFGDPPPCHLFVSACGAPHLPPRRAPIHALPEEELIARLRELGGVPPEAAASGELMDALLPALRADLTACELYSYVAEPPLAMPIAALGGRADPQVAEEDLRAWDEHTAAGCAVRLFDGGHFYLREREAELLETVAWPLEAAAAA